MIDGKTIPTKLVGPEEERAVSPVIGVILMVAITVILAAVIAAFVLDIGPGEPDPTAAVDVSGEGTNSTTVELISTDDGADGIVIATSEDAEIQNSSFIMTTSGDSQTYTVTVSGDPDNATLAGGEDYNVYAFSGELEEGDTVNDADALSVADSFTTGEGEADNA